MIAVAAQRLTSLDQWPKLGFEQFWPSYHPSKAMGWSRAAVDSVKLGLETCLIARSIRLGSGLNPHKVWWAESACVKSYDWIPCGPRPGPGGPRNMVLGVYFRLLSVSRLGFWYQWQPWDTRDWINGHNLENDAPGWESGWHSWLSHVGLPHMSTYLDICWLIM